MKARTSWRHLAAVLPLVGLLAACGGGSTTGTAGTADAAGRATTADAAGTTAPAANAAASSAAAPETAPANSTAAAPAAAADTRSAKKVYAEMVAAMRSSTSFRVAGDLSLDDQKIKIDARVVRSGDSEVSMTAGPIGEIELKTVGNAVYMGGSGLWAMTGADPASRKGKWVKATKGGADTKKFSELTSVENWVKELKPERALKRVKGKTFDGVATIGLSDGTESVLYVRAEGTPYPVALASVPGAQAKGALTFSEWDEPFTVKAPPASAIVKG